jgi:hypothetical protein
MAEEDNPKIRRHLGEIEGWQIADDPLGLNYLDVDIRAARFAWLRSIRPTFELAWYDDVSKRPNFSAPAARRGFWDAQAGTSWSGTTGVLANLSTVMSNMATGSLVDANLIVTDTDVDVVSDATHTHTTAANKNDKVMWATIGNDTRAPTSSMTYTPSGGTAYVHANNVAAIGVSANILIGGTTRAASGTSGYAQHLNMQAADALVLSIDNFVAADVVRKQLVFERYSV